MSNYLTKYIGKYRVLAPIDQMTNDFPRGSDGRIDTEDFYISCRRNGKEIAQISHFGHNTLDCIIFTYNTGRKIIKLCEEEGIPVTDVKEGDREIYFHFKANNMEWFAEKLGAMTQGKNIRPFSIRNLHKSDYQVSEEDLSKYKDIISAVGKDDKLIIAKLTDRFLEENVEKSLTRSVESELRYHKMSRQKKEYIHKIGMWERYLKYLKERL